jgi:signal transduction histidine kinase
LPELEEGTSNGLQTLMRLNAKLRNVSDSEKAFDIIADEVRQITKADYAALAIVKEGSSSLSLVGLSGANLPRLTPLPDILVGERFRERLADRKTPKTVRFDSVADLPQSALPFAETMAIESVVICSILLRGEFLGYVAIANKKGSPLFTSDTESILLTVSDYFAVVLDNVRSSLEHQRAKEEIERLLALAPIGIFTCDSNGIFRSVNNQMLVMLDRKSEEEIVGTSVFEVPAIIKSGLDALITQGMDGHEGEKPDVHMVPRPDKAFYLHAKVTPIRSAEGEVDKVLFVAMDVSSKVRLQNQLERSYEKLTQTYDELERVTKMKTQFIDIVSHELRTPLTVMRGYIELVESEYSSKLDPKFGSRLAIIKVNTDRLYTLVESMLDVSRLEKGALQIHPEPVKVDVLLQDVVNARLKDVEAKKQSMALDIEGVLPLVMADRRRLKDVFNNIIDNAIKYTQEGGRIQVGARDEGKILHVWVKDNGIGIPLENLGKIFDRFHIGARDDLSHQVDRLGLGLPISRGIIEAHGGRIWVESQVGKGSVFHVDIPKSSPK